MNRLTQYVAMLGCVALTACATGQAGPQRFTASGKPEVAIPASTKRDVTEALVNDLVNQGYTLVKADDFTATFEKKGGLLMNLLLGSQFNPETKYRLSFNFVEATGEVRVIGSLGVVTNPGSGFEKTMELTEGNGRSKNELQSLLDGFSQRFATAHPARASFAAAPVAEQAKGTVPVPSLSADVPSARLPAAPTPVVKSANRTTPAESPAPSAGQFAQAKIGAASSDRATKAAAVAFQRAQDAANRHQWAAAEAAYREALSLDGSVAAYHAGLGEVLMVAERWADAEAEFSAAMLLDVDNAEYRSRLKQARARR